MCNVVVVLALALFLSLSLLTLCFARCEPWIHSDKQNLADGLYRLFLVEVFLRTQDSGGASATPQQGDLSEHGALAELFKFLISQTAGLYLSTLEYISSLSVS